MSNKERVIEILMNNSEAGSCNKGEDVIGYEVNITQAAIALCAEPVSEEAAQKLMNDVAEWSDSTFGDCQRNPGIVYHLIKEVPELIEAIKNYQDENSVVHPSKSNQLLEKVYYEFADCFMLLLDSAHHMAISFETIIKYTKKKLEINKKRKWGKPDKNGVVEHIQSLKGAEPEVSEVEAEQDFKDWLGWNDQPPPPNDDPDYYTYSWGMNVWCNAMKYYSKKKL